MKVVKSAYSRKPATKSIKASDDANTFVDETLELEPNDLLLTVDDAAELVSQVASDIAGEEVEVETQIADDAESVDFWVCAVFAFTALVLELIACCVVVLELLPL